MEYQLPIPLRKSEEEDCGQMESSENCLMCFRLWPPLRLHPTPRDLAFCEMFPDSLRRISKARKNLLVALESSVSSIVERRMKMCGHGDEGGNSWDVQVQGHLTQGSMGSQQCSCQALVSAFCGDFLPLQ